MGSNVEERVTFPEFWRVWRDVLDAMERPGTVLLVEGERDRRSVAELGVIRNVQLVHRGRALPEVARALSSTVREVIVLTDWDAAGGELARRLKGLLEDGRLHVNLLLRRRLGIALRGEVVHLEGLGGWARRRSEEAGFPLEEWVEDRDRYPTG
jgi:5S rRNA maturation endonuclease (ribonuclease M5)